MILQEHAGLLRRTLTIPISRATVILQPRVLSRAADLDPEGVGAGRSVSSRSMHPVSLSQVSFSQVSHLVPAQQCRGHRKVLQLSKRNARAVPGPRAGRRIPRLRHMPWRPGHCRPLLFKQHVWGGGQVDGKKLAESRF